MFRVANEPLTMTLDDAITKLNAQLTMTLDDAIAKLSAHSDLGHRGIEILAAATALRDTGGRGTQPRQCFASHLRLLGP